jgi:peptide methionine sulfoxide reductase MsrA
LHYNACQLLKVHYQMTNPTLSDAHACRVGAVHCPCVVSWTADDQVQAVVQELQQKYGKKRVVVSISRSIEVIISAHACTVAEERIAASM